MESKINKTALFVTGAIQSHFISPKPKPFETNENKTIHKSPSAIAAINPRNIDMKMSASSRIYLTKGI